MAGRRIAGNRQADGKYRSLARLAFDGDFPIKEMDEFAGKGKADTGPLLAIFLLGSPITIFQLSPKL